MKRLVVFDLDGTLAPSKAAPDGEMLVLLHDLLGIVRVAVISGGDWAQFKSQLLANLPGDERLANLSLLPTCGTQFFEYSAGWSQLYSEDLTTHEKTKIISSLGKALTSNGFKSDKTWGEVIEDRGSQVTLSRAGPASPFGRKGALGPGLLQEEEDQGDPGHSHP